MRLITTILLVGFLSMAYGQETKEDKKKEIQDWQFRIGPYFWFLGVKGTFERPPNLVTNPVERPPYEIDKSFDAVKNSLASAITINIEYNKNRWLGIANFVSLTLDGEDITPDEFVKVDVVYRWQVAFGEAKVGYRILSKDKLKLDGLAGLRLHYSHIRGTLSVPSDNISGDREEFSMEPIVAARLIYIPYYRVEFTGYIDYGPFTSSEELTNQYMIDAKYLVNKWFYVSTGYKYWLYVQNKEKAIFNGQFYGFYVRLGAQF